MRESPSKANDAAPSFLLRRGRVYALSASAAALMLLASGSVIANPTDPILIAQDTDGAADDLSKDIEDLQRQIDSAAEADRAKRASRELVSNLLKQADAKVQAGDLPAAGKLLDQAAAAVQADDTVTRNRVSLAQAGLKLRLGDLKGATDLVDTVARSGTLTENERARIETLKGRIATATTDARRREAIAEIATLTDQAAIRRARDEVARDPGNLAARLVLGDLLRQAGQFEEAKRTAEALATDAVGAAEVGTRQRALVLLARIATDQGDFAEARRSLDALKASPETPDKATRVADLEARIAR
ncbi:MAG: tetratricopeptide repeat protein, partial [Rhizobiaceae bacterium]|nr:tetratricopeptide repeat protein [Rhizobiaceae bacterium]